MRAFDGFSNQNCWLYYLFLIYIESSTVQRLTADQGVKSYFVQWTHDVKLNESVEGWVPFIQQLPKTE